jgi:hypothetical protein
MTINFTPNRTVYKLKYKAVLAVYEQNGDCFYVHVAERGQKVL